MAVGVDTPALPKAASEPPSCTTASPRSLRAQLQSHARSAPAHINRDPPITVARKICPVSHKELPAHPVSLPAPSDISIAPCAAAGGHRWVSSESRGWVSGQMCNRERKTNRRGCHETVYGEHRKARKREYFTWPSHGPLPSSSSQSYSHAQSVYDCPSASVSPHSQQSRTPSGTPPSPSYRPSSKRCRPWRAG